MTRELLGELEHRVLLAVMKLAPDAYSVPVVLHLEAHTGKVAAASAVHIALRRLEQKGLASSCLRRAPQEDGGRERRYYEVTAEGVARLREARADLQALWKGVAPRLDGAP